MLSQHINRYIELHRSLGFKFRTQAYLLRHFARFAEARNDSSCAQRNSRGVGERQASAPQHGPIVSRSTICPSLAGRG